MTYSISTGVTALADVEELIRDKFAAAIPEPVPGIAENLERALEGVRALTADADDGGNVAVTVGGHAQQGDNDEPDWVSVTVQHINSEVPPE